MPAPSIFQLERHIRACAADTANVLVTKHAAVRMRQRHINMAMLLETLRKGRLLQPPEPDMKHPGLKCRMERFVAGVNVAAVAYIEHPAPDVVVVTVIDLDEA